MAKTTVSRHRDAEALSGLLVTTEIQDLIEDVEATLDGAPRIPVRALVGMALVKSLTLVPRTTDRWKALYRRRGSVERGFGRLKTEWGCSRSW